MLLVGRLIDLMVKRLFQNTILTTVLKFGKVA